ncbi:hypothetical protein, partial [Rhizobium johnstonii]|uniref:hypothetical protein n=1 Tax=Rhizobium johnstonii TaxID=3019933 RepID=UPI003F9DD8E4
AAVPEFSTSTVHIVSGLLLPIWKLLPQDFCRVRRLQTDDGERIVGRVIAPDRLAGLCRNFWIDQTQVLSVMSPARPTIEDPSTSAAHA